MQESVEGNEENMMLQQIHVFLTLGIKQHLQCLGERGNINHRALNKAHAI